MTLNGDPANINTPLVPNCEITIEPSTAGEDAVYTVGQLEEYHEANITVYVNGKMIVCPCPCADGVLGQTAGGRPWHFR